MARRLNASEAGGLVETVDPGKYQNTGKAVFVLWEPTELSEEDREEAVIGDHRRREEIWDELRMTEEVSQEAVMEEFGRLREGRFGYWSTGASLEEAARNVEGRAKEGEE